VPWEAAGRHARWVEHIHAWNLPFNQKLLADEDVKQLDL
jgi:hypothetical protein